MNVLIVDDEALARARIHRLLNQIGDFTAIHEAENGKEAVELVEKLSPDLVLMDIQMPLMDGIEAARHMSELETPPAIIFCTAYDEYAIEAFNVQAVGYLLKPVRTEDLKQSLNKLSKINKVQAKELTKDERRTHISTRTHSGLELIPVENIRLFRADQKYVSVFHSYADEKGEVLIDESLKVLEEEFSGLFERVHRNSLVAVRHIVRLHKNEEGGHWLELDGLSEPVPVSRRHLAGVRKLLKTL